MRARGFVHPIGRGLLSYVSPVGTQRDAPKTRGRARGRAQRNGNRSLDDLGTSMFEPKGSEQEAPVPRRSVHFEQHEEELKLLMQQLNEAKIAESEKLASLEALTDEVHKARDCADSWENHLEQLRDRSDQYNHDLNETAVQFGMANDDLSRRQRVY